MERLWSDLPFFYFQPENVKSFHEVAQIRPKEVLIHFRLAMPGNHYILTVIIWAYLPLGQHNFFDQQS